MGLLTQFTLLLWKNFTLRKRQKVRLVVEVLWPLFLFVILVSVRTTNEPIHKGQCHYPNKAMPSAGLLPWLQGMVCNMDNACLNYPTPGETPGQVNNFNNSLISGMVIELQTLLVEKSILSKAQRLASDIDQWNSLLQYNPDDAQPVILQNLLQDNETFSTYLVDNLSIPPAVAQSFVSTKIKLYPMMALLTPVDLKRLVCEGTNLDEYVSFGSQAEKEAFQNVSCNLSTQQWINVQEVLRQNLQPRKVLSELPLGFDQDAAAIMGNITRNALPLVEEMARMQNSVVFRAARELDFQKDVAGSLNRLLCSRGTDSNSTNMNKSLHSPMANKARFTVANNSDTFCQSLFDIVKNTPRLRFFWNTVKSLLQGKVLYTPDTPAARLIVKEANNTFDALARLKDLTDLWDEVGPRVFDFLLNSPQVNNLRTLLADPTFAASLDLQLKNTGLTAKQLGNFLYNGPLEERPASMPPYNWRDVYNATTQVVKLLSNLLGCFELNKFEAMPNEGHLLNRALELLDNGTFWAGIIFENLQPNSSNPPPYIRYKIRMDIDEVERTDREMDRTWFPGARDHPYNELHYIWGGFAYLQDMIDHGIIRVHTSKSQPLGVYAQQMPYPCYVEDDFILGLGGMLPMMLVLAFIYTVCMNIKSLVLEKELRLKEVLRAVGIQNWALWASRFTENITLLVVPCGLISILVKVSVNAQTENNLNTKHTQVHF